MRSMWKGAISFGLVLIPVKLYAATEQKDIAFRQVHRRGRRGPCPPGPARGAGPAPDPAGVKAC